MTFPNGGDPLRRSLQEAVGGQYEIIRLLGRGGMGAVYLAGDTLERLVAIKVILPNAFGERRARELFQREMRTVAQFDHPNIVQIFASGELDELDYFVMKYVSGDSLAERLKQEGRIPPEEARRILVDVADALYYAHGLGVIHRDVKPANVLVDDMSGRAFLTDFGVSKRLNSVTTTSSGIVAGTPGYMPPEAFGEGKLDHRADLWALGVLGYEMLSGRRPFDGETPLQVIQQTISRLPPALATVAPDVPPDLAGVVMRCLEKDPDARARDARHLRNALGVREMDEWTMPQDLCDMAGFGSWTLLWVSVWGTFGVLKLDQLMLGVALLVIALIVPTGFVLQVAGMRPGSLPGIQIARVAFWPPKWWGMWWPLRLRRPVDLWHRLPMRAQLTRIALSTFVVIVPLLIFLAQPTGGGAAKLPLPLTLPVVWMVIGVLSTGLTAILIEASIWAHREGLDRRETIRMLIGPTIVSRLWDSPKVARLLRQVQVPVASDVHEEPRYVRDCHDKIRRIAQSLTAGSRAAGYMALSAARQLCGEIEALDLEISELAYLGDPSSIGRLEAELAGQPATTHYSARELRRRRDIESRLAELRENDLRLDVAVSDRERLFGIQRAIWRALVALHDMDPDDRAAEAIREKIQRLCEGRDGPDPSAPPIENKSTAAVPATARPLVPPAVGLRSPSAAPPTA